MSEKRVSLDVIGVAEPCHADWANMTGGEQKKFCDSCAKHVHNLSEMTRDEAERFVTANPSGVCIRFSRDAATGKMLTADDRCAPEPVSRPSPGRGRFSGRLPRPTRPHRPSTHPRRTACRMAGHVFVPFLSVFSLFAGIAAVFLGGRVPGAGPNCTMGEIGPQPAAAYQPRYTAAGVGSAPTPLPPAGYLAGQQTAPPEVPHPPVMGIIAPPQPQPEPPVLMGRIAPPGVVPQPAPAPQPVPPPEVMGEIEMIMGDIACPEEPAVVVDPVPPQRDGHAAQN